MYRVFYCLVIVSIIGCSGSPTKTESHAPGSPPPLTIKIQARFTDFRYTYLELAPDGELRFGGGKDAALKKSQPVGTITEEQRAALWDLINENHLFDAKGSFFKDAERVRWDVSLASGWRKKSFECVDDDVPGVEALHDMLFDLQATMQYSKINP